MGFYVCIVRLPFFLIKVLFVTSWYWEVVIPLTFLFALLWYVWGVLMIVTTINIHFFFTNYTPWQTIGEEIVAYGKSIMKGYDWMTEYL